MLVGEKDLNIAKRDASYPSETKIRNAVGGYGCSKIEKKIVEPDCHPSKSGYWFCRGVVEASCKVTQEEADKLKAIEAKEKAVREENTRKFKEIEEREELNKKTARAALEKKIKETEIRRDIDIKKAQADLLERYKETEAKDLFRRTELEKQFKELEAKAPVEKKAAQVDLMRRSKEIEAKELVRRTEFEKQFKEIEEKGLADSKATQADLVRNFKELEAKDLIRRADLEKKFNDLEKIKSVKSEKKSNNFPTDKPDPAELGSSALDGSKKSESEDIHRLLDESSELPLVKNRLSQETNKARLLAQPSCKLEMREIEACYRKSECQMPSSTPSEEQCRNIPGFPSARLYLTRQPNPGELCYVKDSACLAATAEAEISRERERDELQAKKNEWRNLYGALRENCAQREKEKKEFDMCQTQFNKSCNPRGFSNSNECANERLKLIGPTINDAKKLLQKEWNQREKTGTSITNSILD
jgi:hypothetical protein